MGNFKVESRYRKLCNEFRAIIRHMKTAFYRPDYQKLLMCPSIKRLGRVFASNMQPSLWKSQPSFSNTRTSFWGFKGKLKAWLRVWKARPSVWKSRICVIPQSVLSQSTTVPCWCRDPDNEIFKGLISLIWISSINWTSLINWTKSKLLTTTFSHSTQLKFKVGQ